MIIGIDPGVSGAIAFLDDFKVTTFDMPTMALGGKKRQVNAAELSKIIYGQVHQFGLRRDSGRYMGSCDAKAYLEQVSARPGQGVTAMFNFGVSYGIVQGVLAALKIPTVLVSPIMWKRRASLLGKDKDMARTMAQRLFPDTDLSLKKHVGRADAILIAYFMGKD